MSQSAITIAFEDYLTQQVASGGTVTLDQFIFANVPDLDPDAPIDRGEQIPVDYIVYQQDVTLPGVINSNEVVYSVTMGTEVGDFDFNWIGLVNSTTSLLAMVTHAPVQQKFKNADGQQGNTLTRSFLMEYDGAATATAITTPAETWQIDFTARLAGMDERQRLENMDIYGYGAFFGDGYLVWGNPTDGYTIDAGVGYVDGLRVQLDADQSLNVTAKPINVYVDACWKGTLTSVWDVQQQITLASDLSNYTDSDGTAHYVFAVASIDANGAVTDLRPSGSKDNQALSGYLQTKNNLAEIAAAGAEAQSAARDNLALGTAATATLTTSTTDNTMGHVLKVGDRGLGLTAINPTGIDFNSYQFAAGETLFLKMADCTNIPDGIDTSYVVYAYVNVIGIRNVNNNVGILIGDNGGSRYYWAVRSTNSSSVTTWLVRVLPQSASDINALPITGGTITGDLSISNTTPQVLLDTTSSGGTSYVIGRDVSEAPPKNKWYIGNGSSNDSNATFNNYLGGNYVLLEEAGGIDLHAGNGAAIIANNQINASYFEAIQNPGAGSYASQFTVKAPYYKEFNDSSTSVYHPLWKMKDLVNGLMWSGGIIVNQGDFVIQYIDSAGGVDSKVFTFTKTGEIVPVNYANFDARYISGFRMANYGSYGSGGIRDSSHKLMTGIYATNGWDNPSTQEARTPQYCINGSWYDVAYV